MLGDFKWGIRGSSYDKHLWFSMQERVGSGVTEICCASVEVGLDMGWERTLRVSFGFIFTESDEKSQMRVLISEWNVVKSRTEGSVPLEVRLNGTL